MTSRGRVLAAVRHGVADRIPIDAICVENQAKIAEFLRIDQTEVIGRLGLDGRIVAAPFVGPTREPVNGIGFTEWGTPSAGDYGTGRRCRLAGTIRLKHRACRQPGAVCVPRFYGGGRVAVDARSRGPWA